MNQFLDSVRVFMAKLRVDFPSVALPRFTTTFALLWAIALLGLLYGHVFFASSQSRSVSLFLSAAGGIGALFVILLHDPWYRLKILFNQVVALVLLLAFLIVASVTYSITQLVANVSPSIQFAWMVGSVLLAYVSLRAVFGAFFNLRRMTDIVYPGMRSTAILLFLFFLNYLWWSWEVIRASL
ncbi:MAG TPA: hypothetical protein VGE59_02005 [Patescibacteria group bacterium]